jgi:hypothetical protein
MSTRREEIDREISHLRALASQLTDQQTLEGINDLIADLEAEKTALSDEKQSTACEKERPQLWGKLRPVLRGT